MKNANDVSGFALTIAILVAVFCVAVFLFGDWLASVQGQPPSEPPPPEEPVWWPQDDDLWPEGDPNR